MKKLKYIMVLLVLLALIISVTGVAYAVDENAIDPDTGNPGVNPKGDFKPIVDIVIKVKNVLSALGAAFLAIALIFNAIRFMYAGNARAAEEARGNIVRCLWGGLIVAGVNVIVNIIYGIGWNL